MSRALAAKPQRRLFRYRFRRIRGMKQEYDFSRVVRGKFFREGAELHGQSWKSTDLQGRSGSGAIVDIKMVGIVLVAIWLTSCDDGSVNHPPTFNRSCDTGLTWCDPNDHLWFNRQTSDGRTTSLCMSHEDSLTYVFGTIGQAPIERFTFLIQWGSAHTGILWADDERRLRFPSLRGQSDVIIVEKYLMGHREDVLFAFRTGDPVITENQLVRSSGPDGLYDCYIYLFLIYEGDDEFDVARVE